MSYADLCSGRKCGKCSNLYNNNPFFIFNTPIKHTPEQVAQFVQKEGYKLLNAEYKDHSLTIKIECPIGHIYTTKFYDFKKGHRCRKCFESINGENHHFWKGGLPKCVDCGKELSAYTVKRCDKCKGSLENNPNWQGGIGFFPYSIDFTKKLKEKIRERDNRICQCCGKSEKDNNNRKLDVHHIDYNKENCNESNLISLCKICHIKSNYNRDYWYAYYTYLMEN
jgi:hypothetical protein